MLACRLATAIALLAFIAGPLAAQVTETKAPVTAPTADPAAKPDPAETPTEAPPVHVSQVPEPGTILMVVGPAAVGWVAYWRRKWRTTDAKPGQP